MSDTENNTEDQNIEIVTAHEDAQKVLPFPDQEVEVGADGEFYATLPLMELAGLMADSQFLRILFENGLEDWEEFDQCLEQFKDIEDEPQLFN